jgi:UV DNA damage endonuclease
VCSASDEGRREPLNRSSVGRPFRPGDKRAHPKQESRSGVFTRRADWSGSIIAWVIRVLGNLGFVASVLSENLSTSRTCRLRNATAGRIRELIGENLTSLGRVASFLERYHVRLYRISSNLIPFASHGVNTVPWRREYADTLAEIGAQFQRHGVRVSTHPGQYTVLNSPHTSIVRAAVSELVYHATLLDALGADGTCKIVVHVGGLYGGSQQAAMNRFVSAATALPDAVRRRLVVENDDRLFDADAVLQAGRAAGIPVVFDWLHHQANPCRRAIPSVLIDIFQTWTEVDGSPKVHLSSQAAGAPVGAHARFVDVQDAIALLQVAPPVRFDCMLEAKEKDRALLRLRDELRMRGIVEANVADRSATVCGASRLQRHRRFARRLG